MSHKLKALILLHSRNENWFASAKLGLIHGVYWLPLYVYSFIINDILTFFYAAILFIIHFVSAVYQQLSILVYGLSGNLVEQYIDIEPNTTSQPETQAPTE